MQNQWYIARDGKQYGPVNDADLEQLVRNRELLDGDFLWRNGFENWLPAAQVPEVRHLASKGPAGPAFEQKPKQQPGEWGQAEDPRLRQETAAYQQNVHQPSSQEPYEADRFGAKRDELRRSLDQQTQLNQQALNNQGRIHPDQNGQGHPDLGAHDVMADRSIIERQGEPLNKGFDDASETIDRPGDVQDLVEVEDAEFAAQIGAQNGAKSLGEKEPSFRDSEYQGQNPYSPQDGGAPFEAAPMNARPADHTRAEDFIAHQNVARSDGPEKRSSFRVNWLLGAGMAAAIILVLLVGATFALPFIVPPETIKSQISAAIKQQSGRDVSFKGKMSYRFLPSFGLDLNNIVIHNPPTIKGPDFVTVGRLQANLKLLPLLGKSVEIEQIILHRPEIVLINDGKGSTNYEFKSARSTKRSLRSFKVAQDETVDTSDIIARTLEKLEQEAAEEEKADKGDSGQKEGDAARKVAQPKDTDVDPKGPVVTDTPKVNGGRIQVGEIEIINGVVKLIDQQANKETEIKAINLKVQAPAPDKDITAKGSVRFLEDRIEVNGVFSTLGKLLEGEPVKTNLTSRSDRFEGKFEGLVRNNNGFEYQGNTDIQTFSLQNLLNWFGVDVPKQGYGGAYVRGRLMGNADTVILKKATLKFDQATLIGDLRFSTKSERPKIEAILSTDYVNLDPYMAQKSEIKKSDLGSGQKRAVAAWSSQKIDLGFLQAFDGAFQIDAAQLVALGHTVQKARLNAKINAGLVTAQLPKFEIYGGTGQLALSLNGSKARPDLKSRVALKKVQMKPLLIQSAGLDFLSGLADITLDITSAGQTQKELISTLKGTGNMAVLDGAIEGLNIPGALRKLQKGDLSAVAGGSSEKTDFSEMTASFTIDKGMIKNEDLVMKGPLVRMNGQGIVNLPMEQIDYGLQPKLVASLRGQGGNTDLKGLQIPLRIKGPLANPKILPDTKGLLKNNAQAIDDTVETVKKAVKELKKKKISGDDMKNLLDGMIEGNGENGNLLDGVLQ